MYRIVLKLKTLILQSILASALSAICTAAYAQLGSLPEMFDKHFRVEATDAEGSPKVHTQFDYMAFNTLVASSQMKMVKDGFEDHMAFGFAQNSGIVSARLTYNLHRFNYPDRQDQSDDITLDFQYRSLRLQHRIQDAAQVSTIGLPFDLFAVQVDLSFSQTFQQDSDERVEVYKMTSQFNRLKLAASWKDDGDDAMTGFSTEYRASDSWLMKVSYTDDGTALQRQYRSEYTARGYRLAGEYKSTYDAYDQTHITSTISIEKDMEVAALKFRVKYADDIDSSALFLEIESDDIF
jgi:hypothetical protein